MSDNINDMNFKQLRNEVQFLRDELAVMKRKYEDIIYNLDTDNFSSRFVKEQGNMKTAIEVNAEGIKTKVSNDEFESTKTQTAQKIESEVKKLTDADTELSSKITQTENTIRSEVKSATEKLDGKFDNYSTIEQTAQSIKTLASKSAKLDEAIKIDDISKATDTEAIYVIQQKGNDGKVLSETYYYFNDLSEEWEVLSGDSIYTVFNQTAEGFSLKGNVVIDGETVITKNLKLSGNVTWDMENSPVITRYSSDNVNWHSPMADGDMYMQMSFDGGKEWSTSTKVVGTDGKDGQDGWDGSDANVTPQNVFDALTDSGAQQGIFAAFVNNDNQLYINAEMIQAGILSGMTLQNISGTHSLEMSESNGYVGEYGTFRLYNNRYSDVPYFSIFDSTLGSIDILAAGESFLNVSVSGDPVITPYGHWDFSFASVDGISGSGVGGTVVAVFG